MRAVTQNLQAAFRSVLENIEGQWVETQKLAKRWERVTLALGLPTAILSAVAGAVGLLSESGRIPAAITALVAAALVAAGTFLEPQTKQLHYQSLAVEWYLLRQRVAEVIVLDVPSDEWDCCTER